MKTALFDTNILIDYLKGKQEAAALFERFHKDGSMLICSLITRVELLSGIRPGEEEILKDFLDVFELVGLDDLIAEEAGRYMNLYRKSHFMNIADAIIAATALASEATLYTLNNRHFPMNDVEVIKPY